MAKALKLGLTAWSPLANGVLTGKYKRLPPSKIGNLLTLAFQSFNVSILWLRYTVAQGRAMSFRSQTFIQPFDCTEPRKGGRHGVST
jgi:aryl-alcohol dehydrogenase-like predicted oxidoreductase